MDSPTLRVCLTGPGGRIGPHLLPTFAERFDLVVLDKKPVPGFENVTHLSDLSDIDVLERAFAGCDVVIHLAATSDEAPFLEELVPNNVVGLYNVFEAVRRAGVRRLVFASTVQTIGHNPPGTVAVGEVAHPVSLYACTKLLGESMGRYWHHKHGLEFIAVRIGWFQDYDSPHLRRPWGRTVWLSPRDCCEIFSRCASLPGIGLATVQATSITSEERMCRQPLRDVLGYVPQDDVASIPLDPEPSA